MGILNTTPDSFYSGSRINDNDALLLRVEEMIKDGATIVDMGGQSTRPNSQRISAGEERDRVVPMVEMVSKRFPDLFISIDTYYASVAKAAVGAGAHIVNDVSAGTIDDQLISTVASLKVPYVLMHMQGSLETMQQNPSYSNAVLEVFDSLSFRMKELHHSGINDVIIDPGFGFGKTIDHNFELLHGLSFFEKLNKPVLVGLSRKGTVYKTLNIGPEEALNGTTVLHTISLLNGTNILRVHDVKEAMQAIRLVERYQKNKEHY